MAISYKSSIGKEDIKWWDGKDTTFTRETSTGGTVTLTKYGHMVDVAHVYGNGSINADILSKAIKNVGNNTVTFLITPGTWTIDSNLTIPSNCAIYMPQGAIFNISSGVTLTINSFFQAGLYQVFSGDGNVSFGSSSITEVYPEWWGAVGDGTTICTNAFRKMFRSVNEGNAIIRLGSGVYIVDDEIAIPGGAHYIIGGLRCGTGVSNKTAIKAMGMSGNKALFRATASANNGYTCYMEGIELNANGLIDYCFIIEGSPGGTYHNAWSFKRCGWHYANKVGVLIGSIDGSVDVDSYQVNFNECFFKGAKISVYANAQNNYGPLFDRCYFVSDTQTINYIAIIKSGDIRIQNSYFAPLAPSPTITNPRTGATIQDSDIYCVYLTSGGSMINCHTEEARVLYVSNVGNAHQSFLLTGLSINDSRTSDAYSRNLNWRTGDAAYTIYNNGNSVTILNSQIWNYTTAGYSRRIYNKGTLYIDFMPSTSFGKIDEDTTNSTIISVAGINPKNVVALNQNHNFAYWIDTTEPVGFVHLS